jgi:class 3 adenylate cyclase
MNMIDRFIDFKDWSTSRKTVLLMTLVFVLHVALLPLFLYGAQSLVIVNADLLRQIFVAPIVITAFLAAVSLWPAWRNEEGRWTAYAMLFAYGSWVAVLVMGFGLWSTMLETWVVAAVFLVTLWFDARMGIASMVFSLVWTGVIFTLVQTGHLPYAPVFIDRSLDAQTHPLWAAMVMVPFLLMYVFCFTMIVLTMLARGRQDAKLHQTQAVIRRYLPTHLADRIESGEHEAEARPVRQKLTIFFSDIVGFTAASDELDPEELADVLNEYLSEMAEIAERHGASINQLAGDGIMLLFGAPNFTNDKDHARRAVNMALEMQQRLRAMKQRWLEYGLHSPIQARMGINTGYVSVGDFGSAGRKVYTAIGMQANVAARIQAQCEPGKILVSESTWALVKENIPCNARGELQFKGVHYPVPIYEVRDDRGDRPERAKVTAIR